MLLSGAIVSVLLHYLFMFMHEAAHYNLFPQKQANDRWGNLLISYWFFKDVRHYRRMHWNHHLKHGQIEDPENSYFLPLSINNLLRALSGIMAFAKVRAWESFEHKTEREGETAPGRRQAIAWFIVYQANILALFAWHEAWLAYTLVWLMPLICGFPFLAFVRQVCEHRKPGIGSKVFGDAPHGPYTRIFKPTIGAWFLGAAGFRQHWYHHFNPHISYTRLDDYARDVKAALPELTSEVEETTYLSSFIGLVRDGRENPAPASSRPRASST